jgi:uncharacterized protein YhbP (UPF0306 family)
LEYPFSDLLEHTTMTLATSSLEGNPHAAPVYFVALPVLAEDAKESNHAPFQFYFFSEVDSQHSRDIDQRGIAAGAIHAESQDWREIRGLQMVGKVRLIPKGPAWQSAWEGYKHKFPFVSALKLIVARNALYVLTPTWMRLVDNRIRFGFKQEWSFSEG